MDAAPDLAIIARRKRRWLRSIGLPIVAILAVLAGVAWHSTVRQPLVRTYELQVTGDNADGTSVRIVLLSDIHVAGPDMPPSRLSEIVAQVNALEPDIVMIAGDIVSDKRTATQIYSTTDSVTPLARIDARLGKIAVPGNHDHWRGLAEVRRELEAAGFIVLQNEAISLGPLAIGGLDDDFTGHADLAATLLAMDALPGQQILLSHSPDPFAELPRGKLLMLAGHTHCGQIRYPWGGTPATMSRYGDRYACGVVREQGNVLVVTAGIGTSVLPFRFLAPPDIWQIQMEPPNP